MNKEDILKGEEPKFISTPTVEIHQKVLQVLEKLGVKTWNGEPATKLDYMEGILMHPTDRGYEVHPREFTQSYWIEIPVSDILGTQLEVGKWYEITHI
jgi:hypothetical protein